VADDRATECLERVGDISALYSEYPGFKSEISDRLFWQNIRPSPVLQFICWDSISNCVTNASSRIIYISLIAISFCAIYTWVIENTVNKYWLVLILIFILFVCDWFNNSLRTTVLTVCGSTALLYFGHFFTFLIYTRSVGLLARCINPLQNFYLHTEQH
jgi:hypothetical protein